MNFKIGLDGGGTKTECILIDDSGTVVAHEIGPGCNPSVVGPAKARRVVKASLDALLARSPIRRRSMISRTLLCTAGSRGFWREYAKTLKGFGTVTAIDDAAPVLELATDGGPGLVLHAGTGSFVAARADSTYPFAPAGGLAESGPFDGDTSFPPGHFDPIPLGGVYYAGGLGWRFGDPGSADDLGRRAVARALLELQGWISRSGLSKVLCEETGLTDGNEISRLLYSESGPNSRVAALAPSILRLTADGDPAAHAMVVDSTSRLLDLAVRVATKLFPTKPLTTLRAGLSGPILTHPSVVRILSSRSPLALKPVQGAPIDGVRRLLMRG